MEKNRYIEILKWAYEKRVSGFSEEELFRKFDPARTDEFKKWYLYVFRGNRNNEDCLIGLYDYKNNTHYSCLTAKGLSEAISYLSLDEARKNSKYALWFAGLSLLISAWQFLLPVNIGPICYGSTTVGDKLIHKDCMFVLRVGKALNLSWNTSYDIK